MSAAAEAAGAALRKMDGGYTKSYRRKWDNEIFRDYREVAIWAWMCDVAQSEPYRMPTKFGTVELDTGELIVAERFLAEKFFIERHRVRALLDRMVADGMIAEIADRKPQNSDRKKHRLGTVIRIVKYKQYQYIDERVANDDEVHAEPKKNHKPPKNNTSTYVDTIEPDGSIEPISEPANDRQGLGTDASLPGQMPLPVVADMLPARAPQPVPAAQAGVTVLPVKPKPAEVAEEMRAIWNEVCADALTEIRVLSAKRVTSMTKALRKHFGGDLDQWRAYCERLRASPFMCGGNPRGWIGNIDTCIRTDTIIRALEGSYDHARICAPRIHINAKPVTGQNATAQLRAALSARGA